jgi:hypothetical protein
MNIRRKYNFRHLFSFRVGEPRIIAPNMLNTDMPQIGDTVIYKDKKYQVLEVSQFDGLVQLGILNNKGLIIESFWFDVQNFKLLT